MDGNRDCVYIRCYCSGIQWNVTRIQITRKIRYCLQFIRRRKIEFVYITYVSWYVSLFVCFACASIIGGLRGLPAVRSLCSVSCALLLNDPPPPSCSATTPKFSATNTFTGTMTVTQGWSKRGITQVPRYNKYNGPMKFIIQSLEDFSQRFRLPRPRHHSYRYTVINSFFALTYVTRHSPIILPRTESTHD